MFTVNKFLAWTQARVVPELNARRRNVSFVDVRLTVYV